MIDTLTLLGGRGKDGRPEPVQRLEMRMGDVVSIVGPTGSGKTTLINDIELFANANTPSGRRLLVNGQPAPAEYRYDPSRNPIALITQHTTFLSDLPVSEFLTTHAQIRARTPEQAEGKVRETLDFANQLTGEPILLESRMTELSGGQTRSLLIADAVVVCHTPIVLLDEVENAGINRTRTLELLRQHRKIFIFVTHDPRITLLSDYRVVMQNGCITSVLRTDENERHMAVRVGKMDDVLSRLRESLRLGQRLVPEQLEALS